jgi:hypothetical protein
VVGVTLLLAVVALASRPDGGGPGSVGADAARLAVDVLFYLFMVLAGLTFLAVAWALWPRPDEEPLPLPRRRRPLSLAVMVAFAVVLVVWWRSGWWVRLPNSSPPAPAAPLAPPGVTPAGPGPAPGGVDWLALAVVSGLVLAGVVLAWRALRSRAGRRSPGSALAGLESVLDDALEDVLREADPRRAVIAAWARLEQVMAGYGLSRRDAEAPFEYAARAGTQLAVRDLSLERLAGLYEWARFSPHEVTPGMRGEALSGLLAVRDGLRRAA